MAQHKSAIKRIRQTETKTAENRARVSRIRTSIKNVETAIAGGDHTSAREALRLAEPEMMSGVSKGVMDKRNASRKVSRLSARVKALAAQA